MDALTYAGRRENLASVAVDGRLTFIHGDICDSALLADVVPGHDFVPDTATLIGLLTPAQMMKIAGGNTLLCRFRMDDELVWSLLASHGKSAANDGVGKLHASILMAGKHQQAA